MRRPGWVWDREGGGGEGVGGEKGVGEENSRGFRRGEGEEVWGGGGGGGYLHRCFGKFGVVCSSGEGRGERREIRRGIWRGDQVEWRINRKK